MENIKDKIELFKKITDVNFANDYSSIDYLYPPLFIWSRTSSGDGIWTGSFLENLIKGHYALYAHFPFCRYKCTFCRQFSLADQPESRYEDYVDLLIKELKLYASHFRFSKLTGIYFGGGTPTLFNLKKILRVIYENFNFSSPFYLNIESTPDSLNKIKLKDLKKMGLTRLLIGVQSFDQTVLKVIGRPISQLRIFRKIYDEARQIGVPFINVELVCGLPNQSFGSFIKDLEYLICLRPHGIHIYCYKQTPLTILGRNSIGLTSSRLALMRKMYEVGCRILRDAGYTDFGDDFALSGEARNPGLDAFSSQGVVAVGMSSIGFYPFSSYVSRFRAASFGLVHTFNTLDFNKYAKLISRNLFPIEKFYLINSREEMLRMLLMRFYRYGQVSDEDLKRYIKNYKSRKFNLKKLYFHFEKEFSFLKKLKKIKIEDSFSKILFNMEDWLIYSKIFYGPEVLERCRQVINSKKICVVRE